MTPCDHDAARRLLDGDLPPADEASAAQHLGDCPQCQQWLESQAGDAADWTMTRELLSRSGEVVCWSSREGSFPTAAGTASRPGEAAPELPAIDISFLAPSDDPAALGRIGPYEAVGLIGRGGMGVVFKAVDRSLNRFVAIKVLSPALAHTATARQRFAREARAMAALSHEHIVPIYAVDEHQGLPYFAMEYVPGGTLQARLLHQGPLEAVAAVRIAMQTAQALAAAHDSGLVHRDIKPANILLDRGVERVRVADFGLARTAAEAGETATGVLAGTPQFMSPEQIRGESCDGRSDLFSLGSVLYAMCTGREPFRAESIYGVLQRVVHDAPRPIRALNPTTPQWLEELTARLMAKERDERFATAAEVATLLEHELAHLQNPTIVPPPARPWRLRSEHARRRRRAWLAGAAAATLAAIGGAMLLQRPPAAIEIPLEPSPPAAAVPVPPRAPQEPLPPLPPLWDSDGLDAVQQRARALEATFQTPDDDALPADPWAEQVDALRLRLNAVQQESPAAPWPKSSAPSPQLQE